jgi:proline dehydrogenase
MFRSFASRSPRPLRLRYLAPATLAATALSGGSYFYVHAQSDSEQRNTTPARAPLSGLVRSYAVYTMCSMPILVDSAPSILASLSNIPGIKQITEAIVRRTFFRQFVGGESAHETIPALRELRNEHRGAMLSHSVEVELDDAIGNSETTVTTPSYKRNVEESIKAVEAAGDFEDEMQARSMEPHLRRTTVAIKLV